MRPKDGSAAVALAVAVVFAVLYRKSAWWLPEVIDAAESAAGQVVEAIVEPVLALTLALTCALLVVARVGSTRRALRSRVSFSMLPTDTFDPQLDSVLRFSSQLGRVRRVVRGALDRRGSAVRLRLDSAPDGRMVYGLEAPARSRSVVQVALGAYDEVELRDPTSLDLDGLRSIEVEAKETEEEAPGPALERRASRRDELVDEASVIEPSELLPWGER